jgi:hypothetical protein
MTVTFSYRTDLGLGKRQVTAANIAGAELALGVELPQDFKDFLCAHDGPTPSPGWFQAATQQGMVWHGPVLDILSTAEPAGRRQGPRTASLKISTQVSRDNERLPSQYVVIGQMFTQPRMLLLSTAAADHGAVYAWRVGGKRFRPDQVVRVAGSFTEFLGLLRDPPAEVAAVFRRLLADTVQETIADAQQRPFAHLRYEQTLRNIRPHVDRLAIQKLIDDGLNSLMGPHSPSPAFSPARHLLTPDAGAAGRPG